MSDKSTKSWSDEAQALFQIPFWETHPDEETPEWLEAARRTDLQLLENLENFKVYK